MSKDFYRDRDLFRAVFTEIMVVNKSPVGGRPYCDPGFTDDIALREGPAVTRIAAVVPVISHYEIFSRGDHRTLVKTSGEDFLVLVEGARRGHFCDER